MVVFGGGVGVALGHQPPRLVTQLAGRGDPVPSTQPGQQLALHLGAQRLVGDGGDLVEQVPQMPPVQQPGLQGRQGARQPVHQGQRAVQQPVGALLGQRQRHRQLLPGPLADPPQQLRPGRPPLGAHRPRLTLRPVGRRRPGGGELGHLPGPHRGQPGDLPVTVLDLAQRPVGAGHRRGERRPLRRRLLGGPPAPVRPRPAARLGVPVAARRRLHAFDHTFEWRRPAIAALERDKIQPQYSLKPTLRRPSSSAAIMPTICRACSSTGVSESSSR